VVSAGLRWARTGAVMSNPLLADPAHLNIAKVTAQARVNQPCVGVAPRRSHILDAVRSQPEVDTRDDDDDEQKVEVGQCAGSADQPLAHCAESAAAHVRCRKASELAPRLLADQGRNVAEYLAVLPSRDARVIASARSESSVCWIYGWTED
jgi:hypothetical protein